MLDSSVSSNGRFEEKWQQAPHCSQRHKHTMSQQLQERILGRRLTLLSSQGESAPREYVICGKYMMSKH